MSLPISIALIRTPLTANQLSVILVALGLYAAWLFSVGHYWTGVLGGFLSLAASVLDGCDGEIARLKYQESALGCWIETVGDYSYYIAIFAGLTVGAVRQTESEAFYWVGAVALFGLLLTFVLLIFLRSRITPGQPERLHAVASERFRAGRSWWTADHLADLVRGDAFGDAVRNHGVRAVSRPAGHRGARGDRRQRLLGEPDPEAATPAREATRRCRLDSSELAASFHGLAHGDFVGVFEVAADRHAHRDARHADA